MSAETKAALDDAIAAHFADEMEDALVAGYVLQISGQSVDDMTQERIALWRETPDGQTFITTLGLLDYARRSVAADVETDD